MYKYFFFLLIFITTCLNNNAQQGNSDRISIEGPKDWKKVELTNDSQDIKGLTDLGEVKVTAYGSKINTSPETLVSKAEVLIQKEAAKQKAHIVLIEDIKHYRAYGDLPSATMQGRAYGY